MQYPVSNVRVVVVVFEATVVIVDCSKKKTTKENADFFLVFILRERVQKGMS